jgi:multiple sugar transport system substrate-binding protein
MQKKYDRRVVPMNKKIKMVVAPILIVLLTLVVSCSKDNNEGKKEDTLKGEIRVLTEEKYESQLRFAADSFKKLHPKVNIEIKIDNNIKDKVISKSNNKEDTIDIINMEDQNVQYFMNKTPEFALDVTDEIGSYKDKISKNNLDNLTVKNRVYGFPWSTCPKLILYRSDVFEKEGINVDDIKTWNDYVNVGMKVSKDTGEKFLVNVQDDSNNLNIVLANQLGTSYFNKDGKLDFTSPEWIRVTETTKLLYSQGLLYNVASKGDFINLAKKNSVISTIADPSYLIDLMNNVQNANGKWRIMRLPAFEAGGNRDASIGGSNLIINKASNNISAAQGFAEFLISDEHIQMDEINKYGSFPTNTDIYNLVDFNKKVDYTHDKAWSLFANSEKRSMEVNYTKYFPAIKDIVKNVFLQPNIKDTDSKVILDSLQKSCEGIITQK